MEITYIQMIFQLSLIIYGISIVFPIAAYKKQKLANMGSNILLGIGGLLGVTGSLLYIIYENAKISIVSFNASVSFITVNSQMDKLSAFFILILSIVTIATSIYSIEYVAQYYGKRNTVLLNALISIFVLSVFFVFTANNAIWFFITWEVMAVASYFLVIYKSEYRENQKAGTLYIIMTHVGTGFLIINFMLMYSYTGSFSMDILSTSIPSNIKNLMFIFFLLGFGTKGGVVPLHVWLPYAYPAAPSNGAALMSGVMIKTAIYGMLRFVLIYLGVENTWWGITLMIAGMVMIFVGISYAFVEKNIKKLLAFSSIENVGIVFIAMGIGFIGKAHLNMELCALGLMGALLHSFNHSLFKSALFLGAGSIRYATGTKNLDKLGGLIKKMPISAVLFLGASLSISAVVPFNGFIGGWITYQAIFANLMSGNIAVDIISVLSIATLAFAGALALATFVKTYGMAFLGLPRSEKSENAVEVPKLMNIGTGILVGICLIIGILPMTLISLVDNTVNSVVGHSLLGKMTGGVLMAAYPITIERNSISPFLLLMLLVLLIALTYWLIRLAFGKSVERRFGTWDCGFKGLNSRMQYSSGGYSKPLSIVFRFLFRPTRSLLKKGEHIYHPEKMEYVMTTESIFEKYIYEPLMELLKNISKMAKSKVQTGSIHAYLIYIFVAVLVLMLYNRLV